MLPADGARSILSPPGRRIIVMLKFRLAHGSWMLGVAGAALLAVTPHSASAATVMVTYSGYVLSGVDQPGLFGVAGVDLTGDQYTAVFTVDTVEGHQTLSPGNYSGVYGGGCCGSPTPVVTTVVLTINGHSQEIDGTEDGSAFVTALGFRPEATTAHSSIETDQYTSNGFIYHRNSALYSNAYSASNPLMGWDYRNSYIIPTSADVTSKGYFQYDVEHSNPDGSNAVLDSYLQLNLAGAFVPPIPGAPEPATWAAMLVGFGAVGAVMRRRRKTGCPV
jgi:hypothetical protein